MSLRLILYRRWQKANGTLSDYIFKGSFVLLSSMYLHLIWLCCFFNYQNQLSVVMKRFLKPKGRALNSWQSNDTIIQAVICTKYRIEWIPLINWYVFETSFCGELFNFFCSRTRDNCWLYGVTRGKIQVFKIISEVESSFVLTI